MADAGVAEPTHSTPIEAHVWRIAAVVVLGSIMSILDTTIVNVALDTLGRDLHSSLSDIQWVITGYFLAQAAVIPVSGYFANRFGAKRMFIIALAIFTLGSLLCGLSPNMGGPIDGEELLIIFRIFQGIGGGMLFPLATAITFAAFQSGCCDQIAVAMPAATAVA